MRNLIPLIAAAAICVAAVPAASAAKRIPYQGKASGGEKVTFQLGKKRLYNFVTGVPTTCLSIQGGGAPMTGMELWSWTWLDVPLNNYSWSEESKPSFFYNEVTRNHTATIQRVGKNKIAGKIRVQYEFMIPKYPPGTFSIYSCLGEATFSAKAKVKS
jgi:hypothetical protein